MEDASAAAGFQAKEDIVESLIGLGFSRNAAIKGCYYTGNYNADLAAAWIIENQDTNLDGPLEEDLLFEDEDDDDEDSFPSGLDLHKMVFVVNSELGMGVGKVAAQVAHAALGVHRQMIDNTEKWGEMMISWEQYGETEKLERSKSRAKRKIEEHEGKENDSKTTAEIKTRPLPTPAASTAGLAKVETKIVLKGDNAAQLTELAKQAEEKGLPNYLVQDAGRTQIAAGSQTVLGIIGKLDVVDSITAYKQPLFEALSPKFGVIDRLDSASSIQVLTAALEFAVNTWLTLLRGLPERFIDGKILLLRDPNIDLGYSIESPQQVLNPFMPSRLFYFEVLDTSISN